MFAYRLAVFFFAISLVLNAVPAVAQKDNAGKAKPAKKAKVSEPFAWVNSLPAARLPKGVRHATFRSPSMDVDVGYYVYLPEEYAVESSTRFPVVYLLHGGRPGSEGKMLKVLAEISTHMQSDEVAPTIYVLPNGGPISWYNFPDREHAMGEDVFVKELIPHIEETYRTIAKREGRAIEGFSQGGRGTTRIMFRYPELFVSAAPGGSGYGPEKTIRDNDGVEKGGLRISPAGNNCWDLAKAYAARSDAPKLTPLLWVGTKGFNYDTNLEFGDYLTELGVPHRKVIVEDATHSAMMIYREKGLEVMQHHQRNFVRPE